MFNSSSIIKEVNILNKVICYLLVLIACICCKSPIFLIFAGLILLLITKQYSDIFGINIFVEIVSLLSFFYPQILWISKLGILIIYTMLLKKVTDLVELKFLLESTLYRFQSKKITYQILYFIYFMKYFRIHVQKMYLLKDDYGLKNNFKLIVFILKKSFSKTKLQMRDILDLHKLRFYNYSKDRSYIEKSHWESWDTNYLVSHIIVLLLTFFYGR